MSPWHDLSHTLVNDLPRIPAFPTPSFTRYLSISAGDPMNVTHIDMVCHVGTHVDAPCHFVAGAATIADLSLDQLCGDGVVCRVDAGVNEMIEVEQLRDRDLIRPGDILILRTGWHEHFGSATYDEHPSLSVAVAEWLVEMKIKLVAVDTPTPDLPVSLRGAGFTWPVHRVLLGAGVLVSEHVTNLNALAGRRVEAVFAPLSIGGADGAPVRALARPL